MSPGQTPTLGLHATFLFNFLRKCQRVPKWLYCRHTDLLIFAAIESTFIFVLLVLM